MDTINVKKFIDMLKGVKEDEYGRHRSIHLTVTENAGEVCTVVSAGCEGRNDKFAPKVAIIESRNACFYRPCVSDTPEWTRFSADTISKLDYESDIGRILKFLDLSGLRKEIVEKL
jgi:hypothetical protein